MDRGRLRCGGFTLIEILIALLVLAVGLLGFAALQISSVNNNQDAYFQTQAQAIAEDLSMRMQANRDYLNWDVRANIRGQTAPNARVDENVYSAPPDGSNAAYALSDANARTANLATDLNTICGAAPARYNGVRGLDDTVTDGRQCDGDTEEQRCSAKQTAAFDRWSICRSAVRYLPEGEVRVACRARATPNGEERLNPYFLDAKRQHDVFANGEPRLFMNPTDLALDSCPPESAYTIAVYWSPSAAARGVGESAVNGAAADGDALSTQVNPRCNDLALAGANPVRGASGIRKACVIVDVLP